VSHYKRQRHNVKYNLINEYDIQGMSAEQAAPLLWVPTVLSTLPTVSGESGTSVHTYGIPVALDDRTSYMLSVPYTWLTLTWLVQERGDIGTWQPRVYLLGLDDFSYGCVLSACDYGSFTQIWDTLLNYIYNCKGSGINGSLLLDYCETTFSGYERDY
jgi:hypothetical protein